MPRFLCLLSSSHPSPRSFLFLLLNGSRCSVWPANLIPDKRSQVGSLITRFSRPVLRKLPSRAIVREDLLERMRDVQSWCDRGWRSFFRKKRFVISLWNWITFDKLSFESFSSNDSTFETVFLSLLLFLSFLQFLVISLPSSPSIPLFPFSSCFYFVFLSLSIYFLFLIYPHPPPFPLPSSRHKPIETQYALLRRLEFTVWIVIRWINRS